MASRLSEESHQATLDAGQHGLLIAPRPRQERDLLEAPLIDFDALLERQDAAEAVQALPPQQLFLSLLDRGPEDCLEVLPLLSDEQVVRILDYDAWREDRLEPIRAVRWLTLFKEVSDEEMARRFRGLDEEYQLGLLGPMMETFDEEQFEDLSDEEQDQLTRLPCGTLYYRLKTNDHRVATCVDDLIQAIMTTDVDYAYSLISHAAALPPNEQEALLAQFRRARLEEDGFVSYEESLACFQTVDYEQLLSKWAFTLLHQPTSSMPALAASTDVSFLRRVLEAQPDVWSGQQLDALRSRLAFLGNSLAAATQVEPDDHGGLKRLLAHVEAGVSLGLDYLAGGQAAAGSEILRGEHPQILLRVGLSLVRRLATAALQQLARRRLPGADAMLQQLLRDRRGQLESSLDKRLLPLLGLTHTEIFKGLCNRFPVRPVSLLPDAVSERRTLFVEVDSRESLRALAQEVDSITGLLFAASLADDDAYSASLPLHTRLQLALAQTLIGGAFTLTPLTREQLLTLIHLPRDLWQQRSRDILASIEGTLRLSLAAGKDGWATSSQVQIATDPLQGVLSELAEILLQLHQARSFADAGQVDGVGFIPGVLLELTAPLPERAGASPIRSIDL